MSALGPWFAVKISLLHSRLKPVHEDKKMETATKYSLLDFILIFIYICGKFL